MNYLDKVMTALVNSGIYIEELDENINLNSLIQDSLTYITFILEIEDIFQIEFSDEFYSNEAFDFTIKEFINTIMSTEKQAKVC